MTRLASLLSAAALLHGAAHAAPQPLITELARQEAAATTAAWVSLGTDGTRTITPVLTTINGTATLLSPAPADVTGTVFTQTNFGVVSTSTGDPPLPTATSTQGAGGAFPVCQNQNGPYMPFCLPAAGDTLNPGNTYYVTWDPTVFPAGNTTVNILATFVNTTQNAWKQLLWQAEWGFVPFPVDSSMIQAGQSSSNISLSMVVLAKNAGGAAASTYAGPTVVVANPPGPPPPPPATAPTGPALYIGVPVIGGVIVLFVIGTCLWNRKARQIGLGNIMSRSRHGYVSSRSRTERLAGRRGAKAQQAIHLQEREVVFDERQHRYQDEPARSAAAAPGSGIGGWDAGWHEQVPGRDGQQRRDSDALGSLAEMPMEERQMEFGRPAQGNAFRDEISRQEREGSSR